MNIDITPDDKLGNEIVDRVSFISVNGYSPMETIEHRKDKRETIACGSIYMKRTTMERLEKSDSRDESILSIAKAAGTMAAKNGEKIIPMHYYSHINNCSITYTFDYEEGKINIVSVVRGEDKSLESEAILSVTIAAVTIYDMCKNIDKSMVISDIKLMRNISPNLSDHIKF